MSDVRTLLHETAATPMRDPDIVSAQRVARARRRRGRGLVCALAVIVIAGATVGVVRIADDGGSPARVAIGPRQSSDVPDGWTRVVLESGITFAMPPAWDVFDFGNTAVAERRIAIGTARPSSDSAMVACVPEVGQLPTQAGTWVSLWEYPGVVGSEVPAPLDNSAGGILGIVDRPADFRTIETRASCPVGATGLTASFEEIAFRDAGRVFVARIVMAHPGDAPDFMEAQQVLNTLRISPLPPTTTGLKVVPTIPDVPAVTTTAPPFAPTSADEQQIVDVFDTWMNGFTDESLQAATEDPAAVLGPSHAGWASQPPEYLAGFHGRVDSVRVINDDHAEVTYTILHSGQEAYPRRQGAAIRVNGQWKVTTSTVCGMLAVGNIRCP